MGITSEDMKVDIGRENDGYERFLSDIRLEFDKSVKNGKEPVFVTDATGLYDLFLANIPEEARQHYNCRACRRFVDNYGRLVVVTDAGGLKPVMWAKGVPDFFKESVAAIRKCVSGAKITGVFMTDQPSLGIPVTGEWEHMAVIPPPGMKYSSRLKTAFQAAAEVNENHRLLCEAVEQRYDTEVVNQAVNILRSETLYRGEKVLKNAEWLLEVKVATKGRRGKANLLWKYAAKAPTGYCHISEGMLGTLLDDIAAGHDLGSIKRRFADKMDPTQYQRPKAAPTAGNVAQAEKIVEKLGIEPSLERRYARLEEIQTLWKPVVTEKTVTTGVFAGIQTKERGTGQSSRFSDTPSTTMTWEKFRSTVLPRAKKIEFYVGCQRNNYGAILTAVNPDAPPIIQWDKEDSRNPFNWYVYNGGSLPGTWNLSQGWNEVTGIALKPSMWQGGFEHHGKGVFFILAGCKDRNHMTAGNALFPETLKSELHGVRSTIEAYSSKHHLHGYAEASACGMLMAASSQWWDYELRVTTAQGVTKYKLDRWD